MKKLSKKRLEYLLAIMKKNSIEYSVVNNSYDIRLLPEIKQACKQIKEMIHHAGIDGAWLPTPENINALPEPVRKFIHDLETNVDPQSMVRENFLIKDTCRALVVKLEEKQSVTEKWLLDFLRQMPIYDAQPRKDYAMKKFKEAGIKVVK